MSKNSISWVHFGDLHIRESRDENYEDFLELIASANQHLFGNVDFAFLPGDNADDGSEPQYQLVRNALDQLKIPVHCIAGDHDRKSGTLELFQRYLEPGPYHATIRNGFRFLFLNAVDGASPKQFDLSPAQTVWLEKQLVESRSAALRPLVFMHLYPSELETQAGAVRRLLQDYRVELVEMGHTHYNELANDGHTIYAVTRSTGQIEEGPPGFSITVIDGDVISWKFQKRRQWPVVMITSPADEKLIIRPNSPDHVVRNQVVIRAKVWGRFPLETVTCSIDRGPAQSMRCMRGRWELDWNSLEVPDGRHHISVRAVTQNGTEAMDEITVLVNQDGRYTAPPRSTIDYENAIGAYPAKHILGTELGPNEKGTKGPWPSWRDRE